MKVIKEGDEKVLKTWGKQNSKQTEYRPIKYLLTENTADGTLLYNTVSGELGFICGKEEALFKRLPCEYSPDMDELIGHHFLVPVDFDEHGAVCQLRRIINLFKKKNTVTAYTILPTTGCNARCFYCYESNYKHIFMTDEIADRTVKYITENCGSEKKVTIGWFGGEPTLGEKTIDRICNGLKDNGVEFSSSMISNGYLFTEEMAKRAAEIWKLKTIQITLDGTEDIYNRVKAFVGITDSAYKRVLNNIEYLLKADVTVSIRMNLDRHNFEDLHILIKELGERFSKYKKCVAYVHPLFDDFGFEPVKHDLEDRLWLMQKKIELNLLIKEQNMLSEKFFKLPSLHTHSCMADDDSSVIINPNGQFARCEHYCEENFGNVFEGITDIDGINKWKERSEHDKCPDCPLFPKCANLKLCYASHACYDLNVADEITNSKKLMLDYYNNKKK